MEVLRVEEPTHKRLYAAWFHLYNIQKEAKAISLLGVRAAVALEVLVNVWMEHKAYAAFWYGCWLHLCAQFLKFQWPIYLE